MTFLLAILSMSEMVCFMAPFAAARSLPSIATDALERVPQPGTELAIARATGQILPVRLHC